MDHEAIRQLLADAPTIDWPRRGGTVAIRRFEVDGNGDAEAIEAWVKAQDGGGVKVKRAPLSRALRAGRVFPRAGSGTPYYVVPLAALAEPE